MNKVRKMSIKNKTAIITGSTSGIGKSIAHILASKGCNVVINGFGDTVEIEGLQKEIEAEHKVRAVYSNANMKEPSQIAQMISDTANNFGTVDIIVNNAGIQHVDKVEDFPDEKWNAIIAINLSSAFHMIKNSVPHMKSKNFGRIINISSAHGLVASPKKTAYVAAKHGLIGLTKAVALELAETSITCNAICPGWVLTPLVQEQINNISANESISTKEAEIKLLSEKQPTKRFVKPEEIGHMVAYLCSNNANGITGSSFSLDGGWTAQ